MSDLICVLFVNLYQSFLKWFAKHALILFFMSFCDVSFFSVWGHTFISAESHGFSLSDSPHLAAESRSSELLCIFCAASREHRSSPQAAATQQGFDLFSGGDYYYKQISLSYWRGESAWSIEGSTALCCISGRTSWDSDITAWVPETFLKWHLS